MPLPSEPTPLPAALLHRALAVARDAALEAAALARRLIAGGFEPRRKPDASWVTDVDVAVETLLVKHLRAAFPDYAILGEEHGYHAGQAGTPFTWVLDPIDGTTSLVHGVPLFGTLIALQHRERAVVGVLSLPMLGRVYSAADGHSAWRNGERLHLAPSIPGNGRPGLLALGDRGQFVRADCLPLFDAAMRAPAVTRTYCDAFGHALVLDGAASAMMDVDLCPWDLAATEVLLREAGGTLLRIDQRTGDDGALRTDVLFGHPDAVAWWQQRLSLSASF